MTAGTELRDYQIADLTPGQRYRIFQRSQPMLTGEFIRWENKHCQLHGEFIAREALFQKVKQSGRYGCRFLIDPKDATIEQDCNVETDSGSS